MNTCAQCSSDIFVDDSFCGGCGTSTESSKAPDSDQKHLEMQQELSARYSVQDFVTGVVTKQYYYERHYKKSHGNHTIDRTYGYFFITLLLPSSKEVSFSIDAETEIADLLTKGQVVSFVRANNPTLNTKIKTREAKKLVTNNHLSTAVVLHKANEAQRSINDLFYPRLEEQNGIFACIAGIIALIVAFSTSAFLIPFALFLISSIAFYIWDRKAKKEKFESDSEDYALLEQVLGKVSAMPTNMIMIASRNTQKSQKDLVCGECKGRVSAHASFCQECGCSLKSGGPQLSLVANLESPALLEHEDQHHAMSAASTPIEATDAASLAIHGIDNSALSPSTNAKSVKDFIDDLLMPFMDYYSATYAHKTMWFNTIEDELHFQVMTGRVVERSFDISSSRSFSSHSVTTTTTYNTYYGGRYAGQRSESSTEHFSHDQRSMFGRTCVKVETLDNRIQFLWLNDSQLNLVEEGDYVMVSSVWSKEFPKTFMMQYLCNVTKNKVIQPNEFYALHVAKDERSSFITNLLFVAVGAFYFADLTPYQTLVSAGAIALGLFSASYLTMKMYNSSANSAKRKSLCKEMNNVQMAFERRRNEIHEELKNF